jgi:hypothetical protein
MKADFFGFLSAAALVLTISSSLASAGPVAGIARTDGQPLEVGPFGSQTSATGPQITHEFQPMYLTVEPTAWDKTFQWVIPPNGGLFPGSSLSIVESIPLIYPTDLVQADPLVELPIAGWHETIVGGDLSEYFQWDTQNPNTSITARFEDKTIPINGRISFSPDGQAISFDFDPIKIPLERGFAFTPVILDITKYVRWMGPVLDPIPTSHHLDILVSEYPTTSAPSSLAADVNFDGVVDIFDVNFVSSHWGESGPYGDANGDRIVNIYDVNLISAQWTVAPGGGMSTAVPEPSSQVLAAIALFGLLGCLRRLSGRF